MCSWRQTSFAATLLIAVLTSLTAALLSGCNEDDVERRLGQQTAAAVEKEYGVARDPLMSDWVNTMGHRLVGQSHRQNIGYNFRVINTDMVNAFAAPWGYVYVTQGMLRFATSEDEVAFVMAHEIGHVANRDSIKGFKQNILMSIGATLLGSKSEQLGQLGGLGAGLLLMHYSRSDESDADVSGCEFVYGAGYDPAGGLAFFERLKTELEKDRPSSIEHLFLTHPSTDSRIAALKARPELNLNDPAVASRIGRSYSRRFAYATAAKYYKMALQNKPEAVETKLALAESYACQGFADRARGLYEALLHKDPNNNLASLSLQALAAVPSPEPVQVAEQQAAQQSLAATTTLQEQTATLVTSAHTLLSTTGKQTAAASGLARSNINSLMGFANLDKDLSDRSQEVFVTANGAISRANDAAFALETTNQDLTRVSALLQANALTLKTALERTAAGHGAAGDEAIYERALRETLNSRDNLNQALSLAAKTGPFVQDANRAGADTVAAMGKMLASKEPDKYLYPVRELAADTLQKAENAQTAVTKLKATTQIAEARALLAKLNLAALGASPTVREAYDGMIAHYCSVTPVEVTTLRNKGLGFGDAAFVLMAARVSKAAPQDYLSVLSSDQIIEGLRSQGFSFGGPLSLLRFLSNAIDQEVAARG